MHSLYLVIFPFSWLFLGLPFSCALDPFHMLLGHTGSYKQLDFSDHNVQHLLDSSLIQIGWQKRGELFFCKVISENMQLRLTKVPLTKMWGVTYWDLIHIYPNLLVHIYTHLSAGVGKSADGPWKMASMDCLSSKYLPFSNFLLSPIPWQFLQYTCWLTVAHISEMFQGFVGFFMGCCLSWIHGRRS